MLAVSTLSGLMQFVQRLPAVIDRGHSLVLSVAQILSVRLHLATTFDEVPCLGVPRALHNVEISHEVGRKFRVAPVPSFSKSGKGGEPSRFPDGTVHNFAISDWPAFVSLVTQSEMGNIIGIPFDNNSAGPDLVIPVLNEDNSAICLLCWAFKNLQGKNGTSWKHIIEEIDKCQKAPRDNGVTIPIILFIASTRINEKVEKALSGKPFLRLEATSTAKTYFVQENVRHCPFFLQHAFFFCSNILA